MSAHVTRKQLLLPCREITFTAFKYGMGENMFLQLHPGEAEKAALSTVPPLMTSAVVGQFVSCVELRRADVTRESFDL